MARRTILGTVGGSGPNQRVEIALRQRRDGRVVIDVREQHYAEGIGWFDQRTLSLEPGQFRQLQAVLGLKAREIDVALAEPKATLPFPGPKAESRRRPAVGDGA